jgi:peptidoglycan/LPS O-acetylase OafA/YrhL
MRRIAEFDGVRGLAALTVVAYHIFVSRVPWAWAAVDVFFALSGYLITSIILEHGGAPGFLPAFYARRGLRIWPIYYLLLLVMAVLWLDDRTAIPFYLTYTQQVPRYWNGAMPQWTGVAHTWTLALEEQFYLVWPALVLVAGRRRTAPLALALALASIAARAGGVHFWVLAGRCDGFLLGAMLAALGGDADAARARRRVLRVAAVSGTLAVMLVACLALAGRLIDAGGPAVYAWHVTVASLGSLAVLALLVLYAGHPVLAPLRFGPLVYLGTISYGLYLFHYPITMRSDLLRRILHVGPGPVLWGTETALSLVVAVASWHLIEKPILRLKDLVPYRGRAAAAGVRRAEAGVGAA